MENGELFTFVSFAEQMSRTIVFIASFDNAERFVFFSDSFYSYTHVKTFVIFFILKEKKSN